MRTTPNVEILECVCAGPDLGEGGGFQGLQPPQTLIAQPTLVLLVAKRAMWLTYKL